jgi:hypothetical protein
LEETLQQTLVIVKPDGVQRGIVGRILALLKELNLEKDTIVFFASDNGAASPSKRGEGGSSNAPYREYKLSLFEGGIRLPGIVSWPAKVPAGVVSDQPVVGSAEADISIRGADARAAVIDASLVQAQVLEHRGAAGGVQDPFGAQALRLPCDLIMDRAAVDGGDARGGHDLHTLPRELDEAAVIDGCNPWQLFSRVIFPLLKPVTITVLVLNFLGAWNDFISPLYLLNRQSTWPQEIVIIQKHDKVAARLFQTSIPRCRSFHRILQAEATHPLIT